MTINKKAIYLFLFYFLSVLSTSSHDMDTDESSDEDLYSLASPIKHGPSLPLQQNSPGLTLTLLVLLPPSNAQSVDCSRATFRDTATAEAIYERRHTFLGTTEETIKKLTLELQELEGSIRQVTPIANTGTHTSERPNKRIRTNLDYPLSH